MISVPLYSTLQIDFLIFFTSQFSSSFQFFFLGIGLEVFSTNHLNFLVFFHQSPRRFGGFLSIDALVFLYYFPLGFGDFFSTITFIIYLHTQQSLRPREKAIIMTWLSDLVTWLDHLIWSSNLVTWHGIQTLSKQFHKVTISAYPKTLSPSDLCLIYHLCLIYNLCLKIKPISNITPLILQQ